MTASDRSTKWSGSACLRASRKAFSAFESGSPVAFSEPLKVSSLDLTFGGFAATPDGSRFLVRLPQSEPAARSARLILNWPAEMRP